MKNGQSFPKKKKTMWLDSIIKAAQQSSMFSALVKGQFQNQSQIYRSCQFGPYLKENITFCAHFSNYWGHKIRINHKNATHIAVFMLLLLYIHLKIKTDLSACVSGQFPLLDLYHWGGNSCTAGGMLKERAGSCYHWNAWQEVNLWTITAPVQLCESVLFSSTVSTSLI